ncbi:MAG: hypothetical protein WCC17_16975 [Candidatus Nitrosopolaris sp.]
MGNSNKTGQTNYCGKANCELGRNVRKRRESHDKYVNNLKMCIFDEIWINRVFTYLQGYFEKNNDPHFLAIVRLLQAVAKRYRRPEFGV